MKTILLSIILAMLLVPQSFSQKWKLRSDKDGIKVYLKKEAGKVTKSYKVTSVVNADIETVVKIFGDFKSYPKWFSEMKGFRLLKNTSTKVIYYTIFDMPVPFTDRDLVIDIDIFHPTKDVYIFNSKIPNKIYVKPISLFVRIKTFQETATLEQIAKNKVRITFIGNGDLGGHVPVWLQNMFIDSGSVSMIKTIRSKI